jgi:hypothetical protein
MKKQIHEDIHIWIFFGGDSKARSTGRLHGRRRNEKEGAVETQIKQQRGNNNNRTKQTKRKKRNSGENKRKMKPKEKEEKVRHPNLARTPKNLNFVIVHRAHDNLLKTLKGGEDTKSQQHTHNSRAAKTSVCAIVVSRSSL